MNPVQPSELPDKKTFPPAGKVPDMKFTPSFKQRILGLDELRGVAILLVLFDHGIISWAGFKHLAAVGTFGVNIFFVISGYLICTILQNTRHAQAHGFFRTFYVRRIFRIWPLFLVISGLGLLTSLFDNKAAWAAIPYYLTFTMNFACERTGDAVAEGTGQSWLIPFTSPM